MNIDEFKDSSAGKCIKGSDNYWAFWPNKLPPKIELDIDLIRLLSDCDRLLGELSGTGRLLRNPYLLISPYIRREAVSSSKIEGTQSSLNDLFFFEAAQTKKPEIPDVFEVRNYVKAMEYGLNRLDSLPISIRLIKEIHKTLMQNVRGQHAAPGQLRRSQNWIGPPGCSLDDATFVPPPPIEMNEALNNLEIFLNTKSNIPILIQCALMHYQFEVIHPFLDGNGRIGRLLITFFLCEREYLTQPLLYLSVFFEKNKQEYYSRLFAVSQKGDWRGWIEFFLRGIIIQSKDAINDAKRILDLNEMYQLKISQSKKIPKLTYKLIDEIFVNPVVSISVLANRWNVPYNSVKNGVMKLVEVGILSDILRQKRKKVYIASQLMKILTGKK